MDQILKSVTTGIVALSIGFVLFSLLERMFSLTSAKKSWRANLIDVRYAFLSMLYTPFIYLILSAIFGLMALKITFDSPQKGFLALQLLVFLFARDLVIYVRHWIFHSRRLWPFHSIHHSSEELNWLSAVRFHPAENLIEGTGEILCFLGFSIIGFDPKVLFVAGLVIGFYNFFIHSNLRWTLGPLRYVLVSPVLHRWHHSDRPEAADKNFAAMFSCIDLLFGTFYMPKDSCPTTTGLCGDERNTHPTTFAGQLLYPFRKR